MLDEQTFYNIIINMMLLTTTNSLEGYQVERYLGIVQGETIIGANALRDIAASFRDFFGGRSGSYEEVLRQAQETAKAEMSQKAMALGANAIIGISFDYTTVGGSGSMLMVACVGTAVQVR